MLLSAYLWTFQASSLCTGPLSRHLKQLFNVTTLLPSNSCLEREPAYVEFCVCSLVPGMTPLLPLFSVPATIYMSSLSVAGKEMEHRRPNIPGGVILLVQ